MPQPPHWTSTAPPSTGCTVQNPAAGAPSGDALLHRSMQGWVPISPASAGSPEHGTSTIQLQGVPMHDVVLASCATQSVGSTGEGIVAKPPGHPKPDPDELPDPPELPPELEPEPSLSPPESLPPPSAPLTIV